MDEIVYQGLARYFHALKSAGYMPYKDMTKLLILIFYRDFVFHDYRAVLKKEDYKLIERALDCLYGSTCLIPYPDYLKMGKLYLGQMTEMAQRIKSVEDAAVLKLIHDTGSVENPDSDVTVLVETDE